MQKVTSSYIITYSYTIRECYCALTGSTSHCHYYIIVFIHIRPEGRVIHSLALFLS